MLSDSQNSPSLVVPSPAVQNTTSSPGDRSRVRSSGERTQPRLGRTDRLEELGAGGARRIDDVELLVAPVRRHLPATGIRIVGRRHGGEQLLGRGHAEAEAECAIAIVEVEPVVARAEHLGRGDGDRFVAGAGDLEEDLVLALELDLLVVEPARQEHQAIELEQVGLFQPDG